MSIKYSLGILDDNPIVLSGLTAIIKDLPNIDLSFTSDNFSNFFEQLNTHRPDVIIIDAIRNSVDGPELLKTISENYPDIILIAFSNTSSIQLIKSLYSLGIHGYVSKTSAPEKIFPIINDIIINNTPYIPEYLKDFIHEPDDTIQLSQREKSIANHIKNGLTNKEIAEREFISTNTVDFHKKQLVKKFNVRNIAELVREIIEQGHGDDSFEQSS